MLGLLGIAAAVVAALLLALWFLSLHLRDASIIDPVWGPLFVVVALVAAPLGSGDAARRWLLFGLTALWGLRLGIHLLRRKLAEPEEDRRYTAMRHRHPTTFPAYSLGIFMLQGALALLVGFPLIASAERHGALNALTIPGLLVFAIGLAFEAIGDEQLRRFKADPNSAGRVLDTGLWRYTRHPNHFGDACVWWGLWLIALPAGGIWWTVFSPVVMNWLLARGSGKPTVEKSIGRRRPGYADYIERTSGFFPLPPKS